jgi:predicted DNA-binding transcriptional regulator AlpA
MINNNQTSVSQSSFKRLFTEQEAADYLGMSRSYLRQDRMNGTLENRTPGPNFCRFGTMIRYTKENLDEWIKNNLVTRH